VGKAMPAEVLLSLRPGPIRPRLLRQLSRPPPSPFSPFPRLFPVPRDRCHRDKRLGSRQCRVWPKMEGRKTVPAIVRIQDGRCLSSSPPDRRPRQRPLPRCPDRCYRRYPPSQKMDRQNLPPPPPRVRWWQGPQGRHPDRSQRRNRLKPR